MVKFNPKVANKFANRATRRASESKTPAYKPTASETTKEQYRKSVQRLVNFTLFNTNETISERNSEMYAFVSDSDVGYLQSEYKDDYAQAAADVIQRMQADFVLYFDDERVPDSRETPNIGNCIVVRDVTHAKQVVEKFGFPHFMHLDYCLYSTNVSTPFVTWLIEKYSQDKPKIPRDWGYHVHSMSDDGQRLLNRLLRTFERWVDKDDETVEQLQASIKEIMENPRFNPQAKRLADAMDPPVIGAY